MAGRSLRVTRFSDFDLVGFVKKIVTNLVTLYLFDDVIASAKDTDPSLGI